MEGEASYIALNRLGVKIFSFDIEQHIPPPRPRPTRIHTGIKLNENILISNNKDKILVI